MLNLLPDSRHVAAMVGGGGNVGSGGGGGNIGAVTAALNMSMDDDCKSDQSKNSLDDDYGAGSTAPANSAGGVGSVALSALAAAAHKGSSRSLNDHDDRREMLLLQANGQD